MSGTCRVVLHPLVDRPLASVAATFRRDPRGAKGCVKEGDKGLDSGVVASSVVSNAVGAWDEVPVTRADKGVAYWWPKGWVTVAQAEQRVMLPTPCVGGRSRRSRVRATGK